MAPIVHGFDWPDRMVVGTVGRPGARTFYLQAQQGSRLVSVALEKEQAVALSERVEEVLDELMAEEGNPYSVPALTPEGLVDDDPLAEPVEEQFRVGAMSLGWDPATLQIVIDAYPIIVVDADELESGDEIEVEPDEVMRVLIPVGTARAFAKRTRDVAGAGRPVCPLCGVPMDGPQHVCELPEGFR